MQLRWFFWNKVFVPLWPVVRSLVLILGAIFYKDVEQNIRISEAYLIIVTGATGAARVIFFCPV